MDVHAYSTNVLVNTNPSVHVIAWAISSREDLDSLVLFVRRVGIINEPVSSEKTSLVDD